jgi:thioredoxin reductase (NADPH)
MAKPVLLSIDDDPEVLRAVVRDLRRRYADRFRILQADSGESALDALRQLERRGQPVALLLADQKMPRMTGVEFLERAAALAPGAKRALLTAYADTDAAIRAINSARIDYYLMKPWDPPDEKLYPVLDDLLDDWQAGFVPPFDGIRLVGPRWQPEAHELRDFLARNQVPYRWLDVEHSPEATGLIEQLELDTGRMPVVVFPDGSHLVQPDPARVAEEVGLQTRAELPFYDLIIVGGGPAGLAAAVYGASEGLRTLLVEQQAPGGQAGTSSKIENYLGFPSGLSGGDLARRATTQARKFGVEILAPQCVTGLRVEGPYRYVRLGDESELACHSFLIATGVAYRRLEVPGAEELTGAGVFYGAAMTEASACANEEVYIVGAGNSAGQAAMYLARYARSTTLVVRGDSLARSMSQYLIDQIEKTPNIQVRLQSQVAEVRGSGRIESLCILDSASGETEEVPASALFAFIGARPHTDWLEGVVERDDRGFVLTGSDLPRNGSRPRSWPLDRDPFLLEASVPGIFVAGDVRHGSVKRVASGVGEGAIAVSFIHQYLAEL